ncbi:hypothetical protein DMH04_02300 [Kibdelosporangium aridum]|uniref:Uncharacterized protein n=1 Tax=Kibdelosporangium aridum TaxID=2030 RepID=A0A428ZUS3_KIBAR|nr:hypothetical protein [Kibdelosporangium aridum]RSM91820.1 hypothetical protein DMH04_02300 [Kibdelosporangium aridum]
MRRGMYPTGMDYRWATYAVGRRLFAHRSWLGEGMFEAEFEATDGGWHVVAATAESGIVNSYVNRPDAALSDLLRKVIDIAASRDPEGHRRR